MYGPPNMKDCDFFQNLTIMSDNILTKFDHFMIIGDLNYDLLCDKGRPLLDFTEIFDLHCLVKNPTCFMKNCTPSLLDNILTNSRSLCMKTQNFATGISDCHNFICTVINNATQKIEKVKISYRSFKNLDVNALNTDLSNIRIPNVNEIDPRSDNVNNLYQNFESAVSDIYDKHVPVKQMYRKAKQVPYMNKTLRKAIYLKKMYLHKFQKLKSHEN